MKELSESEARVVVRLEFSPYRMPVYRQVNAGDVLGSELKESLGVPDPWRFYRFVAGSRVGDAIEPCDWLWVRQGDVFLATAPSASSTSRQ